MFYNIPTTVHHSNTTKIEMQFLKFIPLIFIFTFVVILASSTSSALVAITTHLATKFQSTKSSLCPHGVHYIDACKNSCSCDPRYGGAMCSRMIECEDDNGECPFGDTYADPLWGVNFQCQCNKDKSQTYECFDLTIHNRYLRHFKELLNHITSRSP